MLALLLLAPFTGEVLSSNVPASLFVLRPQMILFAFLTYSVPVLLLRELWVARGRSPWALFACGLAYGLFNEGLLARTLLLSEHLPVPTFDGYLFAGGLNLSWGIAILVWHAIFSVATPIAVVDALWPKAAGARWLSRGWSIAALGVTAVTSLLYFRDGGGGGGYFLAFAAGIAALIAIAARSRGGPEERAPASWTALAAGAGFFAYFAGLFVISGRRLPAWAFAAYALALLGGFASLLPRIARRRSGLLLFCVGSCAAYSLFVFVAKTHSSTEGMVVTAVVACGCALLARRALRRQGEGQTRS